MIWHRRRRRDDEPAPSLTEERTRMATTGAEIARAEQAAQLAAHDLEEARARRYAVDEQVNRIRQVNRENGFSDLIRKAFGS